MENPNATADLVAAPASRSGQRRRNTRTSETQGAYATSEPAAITPAMQPLQLPLPVPSIPTRMQVTIAELDPNESTKDSLVQEEEKMLSAAYIYQAINNFNLRYPAADIPHHNFYGDEHVTKQDAILFKKTQKEMSESYLNIHAYKEYLSTKMTEIQCNENDAKGIIQAKMRFRYLQESMIRANSDLIQSHDQILQNHRRESRNIRAHLFPGGIPSNLVQNSIAAAKAAVTSAKAVDPQLLQEPPMEEENHHCSRKSIRYAVLDILTELTEEDDYPIFDDEELTDAVKHQEFHLPDRKRKGSPTTWRHLYFEALRRLTVYKNNAYRIENAAGVRFARNRPTPVFVTPVMRTMNNNSNIDEKQRAYYMEQLQNSTSESTSREEPLQGEPQKNRPNYLQIPGKADSWRRPPGYEKSDRRERSPEHPVDTLEHMEDASDTDEDDVKTLTGSPMREQQEIPTIIITPIV